ncbi:MAG: hypothetical protein E7576_04550 [Ruminococcaceae bacterium]|nr:hypothetical protein [Oscillospiraceae bacterium]
MYVIKSCNHSSTSPKPYASLKIFINQKEDILRFTENTHLYDEYQNLRTGINIHAKSKNSIFKGAYEAANSAGCFNVGEVDVDKSGNVSGFTEYNKFMSIITGKMKNEEDTEQIYTFRNINKSANKTWGSINKSAEKDCGYVIVDRKLYKEKLLNIYNSGNKAETEEAVNLILREN